MVIDDIKTGQSPFPIPNLCSQVKHWAPFVHSSAPLVISVNDPNGTESGMNYIAYGNERDTVW